MELIDKEALMTDMGIAQGCGMSCADCEKINCLTGEIIDRQPTIDAEPVRHGEWRTGNRAPAPIDRFVCSVCDGLVIVSTFRNRCMYNYCPNCGAKMDGGISDGIDE